MAAPGPGVPLEPGDLQGRSGVYPADGEDIGLWEVFIPGLILGYECHAREVAVGVGSLPLGPEEFLELV